MILRAARFLYVIYAEICVDVTDICRLKQCLSSRDITQRISSLFLFSQMWMNAPNSPESASTVASTAEAATAVRAPLAAGSTQTSAHAQAWTAACSGTSLVHSGAHSQRQDTHAPVHAAFA